MSLPLKLTTDVAAVNTAAAAIHPPKVSAKQLTDLTKAVTTLANDLATEYAALQAQVVALQSSLQQAQVAVTAGQISLATANDTIAHLQTQLAQVPQLHPETQALPCPAGQSGSITQTRGVTDWVTTVNTCAPVVVDPPPPAPVVETKTQIIQCPVGQTGNITQECTKTTLGDQITYTDWVTVSNTCTVAPPPPVLTGNIIIMKHPEMPRFAQGMKHVTATWHPPSGCIYLNNGDYHGFAPGYDQSYQQENWKADLRIVLASGPDAPGAFVLTYPYEGFGGTTSQPKHPDFCGFPWDGSRGCFWFVPGQMAVGLAAPGETFDGVDNPNFKYAMFRFWPDRPIGQRWEYVTSDLGPNYQETWFSIYDEVNDQILRIGYNGGDGTVLDIFNCKTLRWLLPSSGGTKSASLNSSGGPGSLYPWNGAVRINKEYIVRDGRKLIAVDAVNKRVLRIAMDYPWVIEDLGESPGPEFRTENYNYLVQSKRKALQFLNQANGTLYVADSRVLPLDWKVGATGVTGRAAVYDPGIDMSWWFGGNSDIGGFPNMLFYRDSLPETPDAPPIVVPPPIVITPPPLPPPPDPTPVPVPNPPASTGKPSWVPAPGSVTIVPSSNTMRSVMYGTPACGVGDGSGLNYFAPWCSGAFAKYSGKYGRMLYCNGGDKDYWGTEVLGFLLDEECKWERLSERATGLTGNIIPGGDPNFDELRGEHISAADGSRSPGVPHCYDQVGYLPPSMGGGPEGSFIFLTRSVVYQYRAFFHPHAFDLATRKWRMASAVPGILNTGQGLVDMSYAAAGPSWAIDEAGKKFWGMLSGTGALANNYIWWQDFSSGLAVAGRQQLTQGYTSPDLYPTLIKWGDNLIVAGVRNSAFSLDRRAAVEWDNYQPITLTGDPIPPSNGPGVAVLGGKLYVRPSKGFRQNIWEISPDWSVRKIEMQGAAVGSAENESGTWKRFMSAEAINCLLWTDDVAGPVYAFQP